MNTVDAGVGTREHALLRQPGGFERFAGAADDKIPGRCAEHSSISRSKRWLPIRHKIISH
jgi:hypothetical protein